VSRRLHRPPKPGFDRSHTFPLVSAAGVSLSVQVGEGKGTSSSEMGSPPSQAGTRALLRNQQEAVMKGEFITDLGRWCAGADVETCSVETLMRRGWGALAEQDSILEEIGKGVDRLKNQGKQIQEQNETHIVSPPCPRWGRASPNAVERPNHHDGLLCGSLLENHRGAGPRDGQGHGGAGRRDGAC
jgi:hypothetical protein